MSNQPTLEKTFLSAGEAGDVIYSLPVVEHFGGGILLTECVNLCCRPMTPDRWAALEPLLIAQPFISGVQPIRPNERASINLNEFRFRYFKALDSRTANPKKNLSNWILETHGVPLERANSPWLTVPEPSRIARVVINRTSRFRNPRFPWRRVLSQYKGEMVFIGDPMEWGLFNRESMMPEVPYHPTRNLLDAAQVIAGADLFIGNQSCCYAIAEAMKKPAVLEVWRPLPNCLFERADCRHGWDENLDLPRLPDVAGIIEENSSCKA